MRSGASLKGPQRRGARFAKDVALSALAIELDDGETASCAAPPCPSVTSRLPWFGDSLNGVPLVGRRGLAKLLKRPGDLTAEDRVHVAQFLADRFPPAR